MHFKTCQDLIYSLLLAGLWIFDAFRQATNDKNRQTPPSLSLIQVAMCLYKGSMAPLGLFSRASSKLNHDQSLDSPGESYSSSFYLYPPHSPRPGVGRSLDAAMAALETIDLYPGLILLAISTFLFTRIISWVLYPIYLLFTSAVDCLREIWAIAADLPVAASNFPFTMNSIFAVIVLTLAAILLAISVPYLAGPVWGVMAFFARKLFAGVFFLVGVILAIIFAILGPLVAPVRSDARRLLLRLSYATEGWLLWVFCALQGCFFAAMAFFRRMLGALMELCYATMIALPTLPGKIYVAVCQLSFLAVILANAFAMAVMLTRVAYASSPAMSRLVAIVSAVLSFIYALLKVPAVSVTCSLALMVWLGLMKPILGAMITATLFCYLQIVSNLGLIVMVLLILASLFSVYLWVSSFLEKILSFAPFLSTILQAAKPFLKQLFISMPLLFLLVVMGLGGVLVYLFSLLLDAVLDAITYLLDLLP